MSKVNFRLRSRGPSMTTYLIAGLAALGAGLIFIRALPDLVRYMRVRRM
jgi:hypothetical protein